MNANPAHIETLLEEGGYPTGEEFNRMRKEDEDHGEEPRDRDSLTYVCTLVNPKLRRPFAVFTRSESTFLGNPVDEKESFSIFVKGYWEEYDEIAQQTGCPRANTPSAYDYAPPYMKQGMGMGLLLYSGIVTSISVVVDSYGEKCTSSWFVDRSESASAWWERQVERGFAEAAGGGPQETTEYVKIHDPDQSYIDVDDYMEEIKEQYDKEEGGDQTLEITISLEGTDQDPYEHYDASDLPGMGADAEIEWGSIDDTTATVSATMDEDGEIEAAIESIAPADAEIEISIGIEGAVLTLESVANNGLILHASSALIESAEAESNDIPSLPKDVLLGLDLRFTNSVGLTNHVVKELVKAGASESDIKQWMETLSPENLPAEAWADIDRDVLGKTTQEQLRLSSEPWAQRTSISSPMYASNPATSPYTITNAWDSFYAGFLDD